jgi:cytidylate kinase
MNNNIIAIDGPSGVGKGTLAKRLATHYNYAYMDTGLIYRSLGFLVVEANVNPDDTNQVLPFISQIYDVMRSNNPALRSETIGAMASRVSVHENVRSQLLDFQRQFALNPPSPYEGAILDGRDIGTTIMPDAKYKIFLTASTEARVQRRVLDLQQRGMPADYDQIWAGIIARDERDSTRSIAPLKPAEDAFVLDTSNLDIDEVLGAAIRYVESIKS